MQLRLFMCPRSRFPWMRHGKDTVDERIDRCRVRMDEGRYFLQQNTCVGRSWGSNGWPAPMSVGVHDPCSPCTYNPTPFSFTNCSSLSMHQRKWVIGCHCRSAVRSMRETCASLTLRETISRHALVSPHRRHPPELTKKWSGRTFLGFDLMSPGSPSIHRCKIQVLLLPLNFPTFCETCVFLSDL